jgi:hypothetical protein
MAERKNAIARRIDRLRDQWNEFATNPDARLLRWLIRDDELRVFEAFVQSEQDDRAGEIPDMFVTFDEPFLDVVSYGESLRRSLIEQYEEARPELREGGIDDEWSPPAPEGRHSLFALLETCTALREHYDALTDRLALLLMPTSIADQGEWQRWLVAFAERLPEQVRVAVLDSADAPILDRLVASPPTRVVVVTAGLEMSEAIMELSRGGGVTTPDGQFRVQFAALTQALGANDLDAAGSRAEAASKIAAERGWPHLVAAVHLAMGGGFLAAAKWPDAIARYTDAGRAAMKLEADGDPVGAKLRLQAALGRAAVLFAAHEFVQAAEAYDGAAYLASNPRNNLMLLESWRMAAYCHELAGDPTRAWECGLLALDVAESIPADRRAQTTLPFVGEGLLRVAPPGSENAAWAEQRLTELLGTPDWRGLAAAAVGRG